MSAFRISALMLAKAAIGYFADNRRIIADEVPKVDFEVAGGTASLMLHEHLSLGTVSAPGSASSVD